MSLLRRTFLQGLLACATIPALRPLAVDLEPLELPEPQGSSLVTFADFVESQGPEILRILSEDNRPPLFLPRMLP